MSKNQSVQEIKSFFDAHWTVRKYKPVSMPPEHLDVILHAAQRAPTDATAQMYSFIRLTDPELRKNIATLSGNIHITTASEAFVICADVNRLDALLKTAGMKIGNFPHIAIHFSIGDAVMAAQNMLLASEMLGYQGCWIGGVINAPEEISAALNLPEGVFPFAALTIGVPDEPQVHRPRLPRKMIVHENCYLKSEPEELVDAVSKMAAITRGGNWAETLGRYFAVGGAMEAREPKLASVLAKRIFEQSSTPAKKF